MHVPFQIWFSPDICPGVGLLGHMVALLLVLEGISILLSLMAAPVYIPASSVEGSLSPQPQSTVDGGGGPCDCCRGDDLLWFGLHFSNNP